MIRLIILILLAAIIFVVMFAALTHGVPAAPGYHY